MKTEEKGVRRGFRRGNVLDIVIILLLATALAGIAYRYYGTSSRKSEPNRQYTVDFEIREVRPGVADAIRGEKTVRLAEGGEEFGTLDPTGLAVTPARVTLKDEDGVPVATILPAGNAVDVKGTLNVLGRYGKNGVFLLNGERPLSPGESVCAVTENASFSLVVIEIREQK